MSDTPTMTLTVTGSTLDELKENLMAAASSFGIKAGKSDVEKLTAEAKKAVGSTGTVSAPKKTNKKKVEEEPAEEEEPSEEEEEPTEEDDGLGEEDSGEPEVTQEDVREVLLEVKKAFAATEPTAVGTLVQKIAKVKKLGDVDPEHYPALLKAAQAKLKSKKK